MQLAGPARSFSLNPSDSGGLIWGYRLDSSLPLGLRDDVREQKPLWFHFNLADGRARKWLSEHSGLPESVLELLLDPHPRVRLTSMDQGLVGIIEDLHHDFRGDPEGFGELRFFIDPMRVISARKHPLKSVDVLHRSLLQGEPIRSTAHWLELLVETLSETFAATVRELVDQVDHLEDDIVAGNSTHERRATLGNIRRLLVRFRRHVHADRQALSRLRSPHGQDVYAGARHSVEHLDAVAQDLDLVHERVRLLQEEISGMLAEATNRNIYVLSIVTTALLPATLVTGVWGMNVGGLPWADSAAGFFWTALTVFGSILLSLALLRRSRVL